MVLCCFRYLAVRLSTDDELADLLARQSVHGHDLVDSEAILDRLYPTGSTAMDEDTLLAVSKPPQRGSSAARVRATWRASKPSHCLQLHASRVCCWR